MTMFKDTSEARSVYMVEGQSRTFCGPGACNADEYTDRRCLEAWSYQAMEFRFSLSAAGGSLVLVTTEVDAFGENQQLGATIGGPGGGTFTKANTSADKNGSLTSQCAARVVVAMGFRNQGIYQCSNPAGTGAADGSLRIPAYALLAGEYYETGLLRLLSAAGHLEIKSDESGCLKDLGPIDFLVDNLGIRSASVANLADINVSMSATALAAFFVIPPKQVFDDIFIAWFFDARGAVLPPHPTVPPTIAGGAIASTDDVFMRLMLSAYGFNIPAVAGSCSPLGPSERASQSNNLARG